MHAFRIIFVALGVILAAASFTELRAHEAPVKRTRDVIYGRKYGMALTMDVFMPARTNGRGVVFVVSGGFNSTPDAIKPEYLQRVLDRGYAVFAVVHGSQPRFTIPEMISDLHRAIRYIRFHADDYGIDPKRLGIMGASAGGHLSLMQGTAGIPGDPQAADPVERESSRVQAVACFAPPTDFLNYGKTGDVALGTGRLKYFRAPFEFVELDAQTNRFVLVTDEQKRLEIGKQISPITYVTSDDPPTMIMHGDADELVPIQQAQDMVDKLQGAGVEAKVVVKQGAGHGWADMADDVALLADWFDQALLDEK